MSGSHTRLSVREFAESLEQRRVLSPFFINGTAGNDEFIIEIVGPNVQVTVNGIPLTAPDASVTALIVDGLGGNDTFRMLSNGDNTCSLLGGGGNDTFHMGDAVNGMAGITAAVSAGGQDDVDAIFFNNQPSTADTQYQVTSFTLTYPGWTVASYNSMESATLNCGSGSDQIQVDSLSSATPFQFNGAGGNDSLTVSALGDALSKITFNGGADSDSITFTEFTSATNEYQIANSKIFGFGGPEHTWAQVETGTLNSGIGGNNVTIDLSTAGARFFINTSGGNDVVNVNISNPNVRAPRVSIDTGSTHANDDSIILTDTANGFDGDDWTIQSAFVFRNFFDGMDYLNAEAVELRCGNGVNRVDVNGLHAGFTTLRGGGGNDDIHVNTTNGNFVFVDGQAGLDHVTVENDGWGALLGDQDLNAVSIKGAGRLMMRTNNPVVTARSLSIDPTAALDVYDGTFILDYTGASPIADVTADLTTGHNGTGNWAGPGIQSQAWSGFRGVGYAEASELFTTFPAPFAGVNVDNTAILIRFTLLGDTNLDRTVNISDFARLAANFNNNPSSWSRGDFNYAGGTEIGDFSFLATNFNRTYPTALPRSAGGFGASFSDNRIAFAPAAEDAADDVLSRLANDGASLF